MPLDLNGRKPPFPTCNLIDLNDALLHGTLPVPVTQHSALSTHYLLLTLQMKLHESQRALNDLTRSVIIVLVIKTMNALRMVGNSDRNVL